MPHQQVRAPPLSPWQALKPAAKPRISGQPISGRTSKTVPRDLDIPRAVRDRLQSILLAVVQQKNVTLIFFYFSSLKQAKVFGCSTCSGSYSIGPQRFSSITSHSKVYAGLSIFLKSIYY